MIDFIKRLILKYGFGRRQPKPLSRDEVRAHFMEISRQSWAAIAVEAKNARLASIARERGELKDARKKAVSQKKKLSDIDRALRALTNEEIKLELGR